jgi:hypothetical protein
MSEFIATSYVVGYTALMGASVVAGIAALFIR